MRDYVDMGATPHDEPCAQVGTPDYEERARVECRAYVEQLHRLATRDYPTTVPAGARIRVKANAHDYGSYFEVVVDFDNDDEAQVEFAYWLEAHAPAHWDDDAKRKLGIAIVCTSDRSDVRCLTTIPAPASAS